jgi:peptidyl-tRNA hydrolase
MMTNATPPAWALAYEDEPCTLAECPVGLFVSSYGTLCLKSEYGNNEGRIDAYIVDSGEFFWGENPQTIANQRRQIVRPVTVRAGYESASARPVGDGGADLSQEQAEYRGRLLVAYHVLRQSAVCDTAAAKSALKAIDEAIKRVSIEANLLAAAPSPVGGEHKALIERIVHAHLDERHLVWPKPDDCDDDSFCGYVTFAGVWRLIDSLAAALPAPPPAASPSPPGLDERGVEAAARRRLYIVMRADLKMSRGKEIAQAIHAFRSMDHDARHNVYDGTAVIGVRVNSAEELEAIIDEAHYAQQPWGTFLDAGLTHNAPDTRTCAAIGPVATPGPLLAAARLY